MGKKGGDALGRIERTVEIKALPEKVWKMLALDRLQEWMEEYRKNLKSMEYTSEVHTTHRNIKRFLERASYRADLPWKITSHNLRLYFSTRLKMARLNDPAFNDALVEYWMWRSLGRVKGAYMAPPVPEQLRLYKLAETRLEPAS